MVVGADEAGKGPALGPMVAGAVRAAPADLPAGLDDSKQLSAARREELAADLREHPEISVATAVVPSERIDAPETDMNTLGVAAQAEAVAAVAVPGDDVVADAADTDEARFGRRLTDAIAESGLEVAVTAEHGADETHAIVSAASVIAKVERDRRMAEIDAEYDREVGSGYPSDPTTTEFLAAYVDEHGELPDCARATWATCEDALASAEQSGLSDF
ncbi:MULTISPECIES: ribonuclease HII [Halolamina]|uniref:Ribonuclease HII n=1 Tax=Halolamina pelagica TaxID=699431 RepID=A0A1I5RVJ7_9EURY|nr:MULTISPECIES: ribonuclease HII [Halolamina]NHX35372.1 ribonuclease HII [Halolamina sp. R1-12]SFP62609.1 RNase HII [Halolamina pelagica]